MSFGKLEEKFPVELQKAFKQLYGQVEEENKDEKEVDNNHDVG